MGVWHRIIVEPEEKEAYDEAIEKAGINAETIVLDLDYKEQYEKCDDLGLTRSTGPGPARNFAWDISIAEGYDWHWVMDDNIRKFVRFNYNELTPCNSPGFWRAMEDFSGRYENVAMAGPNYTMFVPSRILHRPYTLNTRIYSCNLIRNDVPFRWRGRYNEDTILSLDMLKAGWCTIQFYAFLQMKLPTQTMKGGNTQEFYHAEGKLVEGESYAVGGTDAKSEMLAEVHPDVAKVTWRFSRVHHIVDYKPFRGNILRKRKGLTFRDKNEYGMSLEPR